MEIVVVQKQTTLERYTRRDLNIDFYDYLEKAGQDVEPLLKAHDAHCATRDALLSKLNAHGLNVTLYNLDELSQSENTFYSCDDKNSGLSPQSKIVISLGGDGTLLHASHYVGGETTLFGINSSTAHSVGHLCCATSLDFSDKLEKVLAGKFSSPVSVRRLRVRSELSQRIPLALNDILFCNRHPAATCRYEFSIHNDKATQSEKHLSSGLWIAGPAGSTAAIASYGLPRLNFDQHSYLYAVREPYAPSPPKMRLQNGLLNADTQSISLFCRIRQGLVCLDGPDSAIPLGFGDRIHIDLPQEASLRLLMTSTTT